MQRYLLNMNSRLLEGDISIFLKRRYHTLADYIRSSYNWLDPVRFKNFDEFIDRVIFSTVRDFTSNEGGDYDNVLKLRDEIGNEIKNIIMDEYFDEILQYYKDSKNLQENIQKIKKVMGINEDYTAWVKRRMDMVRNAEREASSYMVNRFKQNPAQYTKSKFTHMFFSIMMDELHGELSNWGIEDFDYSKVHQELRDSFTDYVEELWRHLNK